ncbi:MDR family MFS transporter [Paenibacillus sp. Marseille-Q7038]
MKKNRAATFVTVGLLLGIFASAIDNTIVATAMGTIVGDLGNYDQFIWVTAAYMVAMMAGMPIYGKLSDMYGRKRFFLFGLTVFIIGSALCGLSQTMGQLIAFRVIQGIGGGALMPIAFTIIFDLFPVEKRGKMTGLLGAVFGLSSVVGPLLGAFLTDALSWHWIFYVNLPIGALSIFFIAKYYKETLEHKKQKIDWAGAFTLVLAIVCFMFALELGGGDQYPWNSGTIITLISVAVVSLILFIIVETKAEEPIIPFWMFKKRLFATSQALAFIYGGTFIILSVFIPIFVQAVYGGSATNAGVVLMPMVIGTVIGSMISGLTQTKIRFRSLMIMSVFSFLAGMILLSTMTPETSRIILTLYMFIAGFGVGFSFSLLPTASINQLSPRFRGTANSTNSFLRSFGMTVGLTIFGTLQTNTFTKHLADAFGGASGGFAGDMDTREIFTPQGREKIPPEVLSKITQAMSDSITHVFQIAIIPIAIAVVIVFLMGSERAQSSEAELKESV